MEIILRDIQSTDKEFLFTVYASTRADEMALVDWKAEAKYAFPLMQFEAQDRYYKETYQGAQYQIIQLDDKPVGRLYAHRRKNETRIIDIALLPEFRQRRIGSTLSMNRWERLIYLSCRSAPSRDACVMKQSGRKKIIHIFYPFSPTLGKGINHV